MAKEKKYVLLQDIVIKKGTTFSRAPWAIKRGEPFVDVVIGLGKDEVGTFSFPESVIDEFPDFFAEMDPGTNIDDEPEGAGL